MEPVEINAGGYYLRALRADDRMDDRPRIVEGFADADFKRWHPMVEMPDGALFALDARFLRARVTEGAYWALFNALPPPRRKVLRDLFGHAVEWYAASILRETRRLLGVIELAAARGRKKIHAGAGEGDAEIDRVIDSVSGISERRLQPAEARLPSVRRRP